jgi:hypothetical protein
MRRSYSAIGAFLAGCTRATVPDPVECPTFAELALTNPDGTATEADLAEAAAAIADFAAWTAAEGVCVGEVRMVADADPGYEAAAGSFSASRQLVLVEPASEFGIPRTVIHELCHAWDDVKGFSETYADLVPQNWYRGAELDAEEQPLREHFARHCESGPRPRALAEAAEAACGPGDPWEEIVRKEVFPAYEEEIPIGVGVEMRARELEIPGFPEDVAAYQVQSFGDQLVMVLNGGTTYALALVDLATLTWREIEVPRAEGETFWLLRTLPDTPPVLAIADASGASRLVQLNGEELVPHPAEWIAPLLAWSGGATVSIGATGATWQLWGDSQPLQARAFDGGEAYDVPGAGALTLAPTGTALPEGELVWEEAWNSTKDAPWSLGPAGVAPAWVPTGVTPTATLPDGRVVATAWWSSPDGEHEGWLLRDADDDWWFSPSSCTSEGHGVRLVAGGGRVVRIAETAPLRLEELVVEGG